MNKDFQILTRGGGTGIDLHENRIINKKCIKFQEEGGGVTLFNCPISLKIDSDKMLIMFDMFPNLYLNILRCSRVFTFETDGQNWI